MKNRPRHLPPGPGRKVPGRRSLTLALRNYRQALDQLSGEPQTLLAALLRRDAVEAAFQAASPASLDQVQECAGLDEQLRQVPSDRLSQLPEWRRVCLPAETAWWWFLDQEAAARKQRAEEREQKNDLIWLLAAGALVLFTGAITLEIIKRLWTGASDFAATFGTLFTLLLTASPFSKRGQEFVQWLLDRLPSIRPRYRGEAMAAMAAVAFVLVLLIRLFGLPWLAAYYNNRGLEALLGGDVTTAQGYFRQAVALNPDQVVAYQNVADVYARIGRPDEAIEWYQQAIAHDLNFGPAYASLSEVYNQQGSFELAEQVALAGLRPENKTPDANVELVTRYDLLSNLGWAYFGQEKVAQAQEALEAAIALEADVNALEATRGQLRRALPHYYLAQVYEEQAKPNEAEAQWRESLRYLNADNWGHREWLAVVQEKLNQYQ